MQEVCWEMFSVATVEGGVKSRTGHLGKPNSKATGAEASARPMGAWEPKRSRKVAFAPMTSN